MRADTAELLACPLCYGPFRWEAVERTDSRILEARVPCPACGTTSAVRNGVGYFRPGDAVLEPPGPSRTAADPPDRAVALWRTVRERASPVLRAAFGSRDGAWL